MPESIHRAAWCEVLQGLGIPTDGLRTIVADPRTVTLTFFATVDGKKIPVGDGIATVTHTIPLR